MSSLLSCLPRLSFLLLLQAQADSLSGAGGPERKGFRDSPLQLHTAAPQSLGRWAGSPLWCYPTPARHNSTFLMKVWFWIQYTNLLLLFVLWYLTLPMVKTRGYISWYYFLENELKRPQNNLTPIVTVTCLLGISRFPSKKNNSWE